MTRIRWSSFLITILLISAISAKSAENNSKELNFETRSNSFHWRNPLLLGSLMAGTLAFFNNRDARIDTKLPKFLRSDFSQDLELKDMGEKGTFFEELGGPIGVVGTAGAFYFTGLITDSEKSKNVGVLAVQAVALNSVLVVGLKTMVGRERPTETNDSDVLKPLSGHSSFPSGHTSTAFALATVVSENYRSPWVAGVSYGAASLVGAGRVIQGQHWTSDVIAGAMLGYGVGRFVSHKAGKRTWQASIDPSSRSILLTRTF